MLMENNKQLTEKLLDIDTTKYLPTAEEVKAILEHKDFYETHYSDIKANPAEYKRGKKWAHMPWAIGYRLHREGDQTKIVRYLLAAMAISWEDLITQLKTTCRGANISKTDLTKIVTDADNMTKIKEAVQTALNSVSLVKEGLVEAIEKHDKLNPVLFDSKRILKKEVSNKLLEIVDEFKHELSEDAIKITIKDIVLIGSNVSYNYTKDSDLDVHILADTTKLDCPDELYPLLYGAYRCLFNNKFDIDFYGIPVEIFVETEKSNTVSNGIYSVLKDKWVKEPTIESIPEYDKDAVEKEVDKWITKYDELINDSSLKNEDKVVKLIDDIYEIRKKGISTEGEYSTGNLVFKELRNKGKLDKLKDYKNQLISKRLSIKESLNSRNRELARIQIARAAHNQVIMQNNGYFQIYNVLEDEVDQIVTRLRQLECIEVVRKGALGQFNFNRLKPIGLLTKYYSITGKVKESE